MIVNFNSFAAEGFPIDKQLILQLDRVRSTSAPCRTKRVKETAIKIDLLKI